MKVTFDNVYNAFQIIAPKGTMISFTGEPTALADGVYLVGDDGIINLDEQFLTDTLYLSTEGTDYAVTGGMRVTYPLGDETVIIRAGSSTIPFSKGGKGGGGSGGDNTHYKGTTTTPISNGSKTNPITIDGESYTAIFGDIVVYGYTEFVFDGSAWSEFGRPFDTTPTSGSANAVTSDGIYKLVRKDTGAGTVTIGGGTGLWTHYQPNMVVCGYYNTAKDNDIFEIGAGANSANRKNIVEVNSTELNVNGDIRKNNVSLPTPYTTMPTITAAMLGQIAQYVGETTNDYVKGYFYIASSDGAAEPTYSWVSMVDNVPISGSKNFVTSGAVYNKTPMRRGTGLNSAFGYDNASSAVGAYSFSFGRYALAQKAYSVAIGDLLTSNSESLFAIGKCNSSKNGDLFEIGNGSSGSNRSNILEVNYNRLNVNGDIKRDGIGIDDYTTTERKIGKWIDGSDLYQRTFEVTASSVNGWNNSVLGTSGIKIVDVQGFMYGLYEEDVYVSKPLVYYRGPTDFITLTYDSDVYVYIMDGAVSKSPMPTLTITIKYTKTSEQSLNQSYQIPSDNPFNISVTEASEAPTEDDMR